MINLGRYPGNGLPNVYLPFALIDWILTGVAVAIVLAIWVMVFVFREELFSESYGFLISGGLCLFVTAFFIWSARAPVKFINFPVPVNEQNIQRQYFLVSRFLRVLNIVINLLFLCTFLSELEVYWGLNKGFFEILSFAVLGLMLLSFIVYYLIAFRWKRSGIRFRGDSILII